MQYFCKDKLFLEELNKQNKLASKDNMVTILFSKLLHNLWNTKRVGSNCFKPDSFKRAIGITNSMFKGFDQCDSGELVIFLLD